MALSDSFLDLLKGGIPELLDLPTESVPNVVQTGTTSTSDNTSFPEKSGTASDTIFSNQNLLIAGGVVGTLALIALVVSLSK